MGIFHPFSASFILALAWWNDDFTIVIGLLAIGFRLTSHLIALMRQYFYTKRLLELLSVSMIDEGREK